MNAELGWAAGMIDGEGTITIRPPGRDRQAQTSVVVASNCREALERVQKTFGGLGRIGRGSRPKSPRHNQGYMWRVFCRQAVAVIQQVAPLLTIKRPQAAVALEFARNIGPSGRNLSEDERKARSILFDLMSALNRRGK